MWQKELNRFSDFLLKAIKKQEDDIIRLEDRVNIIESSWQTPQLDHTQQILAIIGRITAVINLIPKDNFDKCNCTCDAEIGRINITISSLGSYFAEKSKLMSMHYSCFRQT